MKNHLTSLDQMNSPTWKTLKERKVGRKIELPCLNTNKNIYAILNYSYSIYIYIYIYIYKRNKF